jgi:outer membrane protein assembly factor BamD
MRILTTAIIIVTAMGCSTVPKQAEIWPAERYYNEARQAQSSGDFQTAIKYFSELEVRYPLSPHTQLAPLEIAYAYYKSKEHKLAIEAADRFVEYHPDHPNVDYALYLKGLTHFDQAHADSDNIIIEYARDSYQHFSNLTQNFPDSQYRNDSLKRMKHLRNQLAQHELSLAIQQLEAGDIAASKKRAKYVIEHYPKSPAATDALLLTQEPIHIGPKTNTTNHISKNEPVISQPITNSIRQEDWLLQQNPDNYTIQIAGTSKIHWLQVFIEKNQLQKEVAYFKRPLNGKEWYSVLYGNFDSRTDASAKAKTLKKRFDIKDVWVRQFNQIHTTILQARSPSP